jgi:two-component sensor histidine kinase
VYSFRLQSVAEQWAIFVATVCQLAVVGVIALHQKEVGRQQGVRETLVAELHHRVKNTLSIVQSLAQQTFRAGSRAEVVMFERRLQALAGAHNLLTSGNWGDTEISAVVTTALLPFAVPDARLVIKGPRLKVNARTAVNLTLAIHELATNAVKYGALSNEDGIINITWSDGHGFPKLFEWEECGGPRVAPLTRQGFGTRLVQRGLAGELGANVSLDFKPEGLHCRIEAVR